MTTSSPPQTNKYWLYCASIITVLTVLRLAILYVSPFNLGPDEAQYWSWSLEPAFGYFSKPPMIAWSIWVTTNLFGQSETAIRVASPLFHMGTSLMIFLIAAELFDKRTGFWASITFATIPAVFFSSGIISTDVMLLFFWSVALYAFIRLKEDYELKWALLLGLALGLGLMSKYAMIYFILCAGLYFLLSRQDRPLLTVSLPWISILIAFLIVAPNVYWNMNSGMATFTHTAANANWQGQMFNLNKMVEFFGSQAGVFGPILFLTFLVIIYLTFRGKLSSGARSQTYLLLICFSLPVLVLVTGQAFLSRANANWAALTYVAAPIAVAGYLIQTSRRWLLIVSTALHLSIAGLLYFLIVIPGAIEDLGFSNSFKRVRAWDQMGERIVSESELYPYTSIMGDDRLITAELLYYTRQGNVDVSYWDEDLVPTHHYELSIPLNLESGQRVLLVSKQRNPDWVHDNFDSSEFLRTITVETGVNKSRSVHLFRLSGYRGRGENRD